MSGTWNLNFAMSKLIEKDAHYIGIGSHDKKYIFYIKNYKLSEFKQQKSETIENR